jgi:hypothetical protein
MPITTSGEKRGLRLVDTPEPSLPSPAGRRWPVDLRRGPFRPGELPESLLIDLDPGTMRVAAERAGGSGLPLPLWARIAIELGRARDNLVRATSMEADEIDNLLDAAAQASPQASGLSALERYGIAVLEGGAAEPVDASEPLEILVPSEMALAWRQAAAGRDQSLDSWAAGAVGGARAGVEKVEARAAALGEPLVAWCYAAFLAWSTSRSASAQART